MKHVMMLLVLCAMLFSAVALGQVEVWRKPLGAGAGMAAADKAGNLFYNIPSVDGDTLVKLSTAGVEIWRCTLDAGLMLSKLYPTRGGAYVLFNNGRYAGFVDSLGHLPKPLWEMDGPVPLGADGAGNLIWAELPGLSDDGAPVIHLYGKTGEQRDVYIPNPPKGYEGMAELTIGPYLMKDGSIVYVHQYTLETVKKKTDTTFSSTLYIEYLKITLDGNGAIKKLVRKAVSKEVISVWMLSRTMAGYLLTPLGEDYGYYRTIGEALGDQTISSRMGENIVLCRNADVRTVKLRSGGVNDTTERSEGRILTLFPGGKAKLARFFNTTVLTTLHGKAKTIRDQGLNYIENIEPNTPSGLIMYYQTPILLNGKLDALTDTLVRFNLMKQKTASIVWDPWNSDVCYHPSGHLFQIVSETKIFTRDSLFTKRTDFTFTDTIVSIPWDANTLPGALFMFQRVNGKCYLVKYTLPAWPEAAPLARSVEHPEGEPQEFRLEQNYPNPFNPTTDIGYRISDVGLVRLKVYTILGQEVATLVDETKEAGAYEVQWNASGMPSGVYFYRLTIAPITGEDGTVNGQYFSSIKKMMLVK